MNQTMENKDRSGIFTTAEAVYESMGISRSVYLYGESVLNGLKDRFLSIDERAERNQLKVIKAMQDARIDNECFNA
ncbi:MAG: hypothetical protein PUE94_01830, partial [Lachnospiraceae bacterium]|nr:hypothetical protein [Lachnospiraceae bacterium]